MDRSATFDDLLTQLGTGRWNLLYFITVAIWFGFLPPIMLSVTFLAPPVAFTCRPPPDLNVTISEDSCSYLVNRTTKGLTKEEEEPCTEWDFDTSVFSSTLTSEFSLVCGQDYLRAIYQSIFMMAAVASSLLCGYLADRLGRWKMVTAMQTMNITAGLAISFIRNFTAILVLRTIVGSVFFPTIYVLAMEVCETRLRSTVGILMSLPWAFGTMAWGGVSYLIRDWRLLQLTVSLPGLLILPMLWFMDESPRWLIVRGEHDRAFKVLQKAARWNNVTLPPKEQLFSIMRNIQESTTLNDVPKQNVTESNENNEKQRKCGVISVPRLCRTREIRIITVAACVAYFSSALVFYGLNLNGNNFSADPFVYMVLSGLMEVPSYSLSAPIIARFGRKKPLAIGYFISGVSILALAFISLDIAWLVLMLAMLGKMCISGTYLILYIFCAELFPTEVRIQGIGVGMTASRISSVIAPFITEYLGSMFPWVASLVFGGASLAACLATLTVRETLGIPLPDTIADLQQHTHRNRRSDYDGEEEISALNTNRCAMTTNKPSGSIIQADACWRFNFLQRLSTRDSPGNSVLLKGSSSLLHEHLQKAR